LNDYLWNTISVRDNSNFYHGILLGLLSHKENWRVISNAESGEGYSDILVEVPGSWIGVVIEVKYAQDGKLEESCAEALSQIEGKQYDARLLADGMQSVVKFGIACFRKHCRVVRDLKA
jgi:CheY-like chemotaxis protein